MVSHSVFTGLAEALSSLEHVNVSIFSDKSGSRNYIN